MDRQDRDRLWVASTAIPELFPRSHFEILEESAHIMWLAQPDLYFRTVERSLGDVRAAASSPS